MLDERWSEEVEEVGAALARMLAVESSADRVRWAEAEHQAVDPLLDDQLAAFGLRDLEAGPELFARIALELGRALASTCYVETTPMLALFGRQEISCGLQGPVPARVPQVAIARDAGLWIERLNGSSRRTTAGDYLVVHSPSGDGERIGDLKDADRLSRYAALVEAARMVGAGQALLAYGAAYAREREQFGRIIGTYQGVSHRLARAAGELDAAELLVRKAAFTAREEVGGDGAPPQAFAIMVFAKAVDAARSVATNVHQIFGGNGFAMEYDVQLYSRRLRSWAMRGRRPGAQLAELGRMVLDPTRRDRLRLLWHYEEGIQIPRWAREADRADGPAHL